MLNESSIEIRPVDMTNWADFEAFFESKGRRLSKNACGQVFRLVFWLTPMDVRSHGAPSPPERHIKDWAATTI